jgi:uncharacterized membrane protein YdjX (TVP38/TMEM64 family)
MTEDHPSPPRGQKPPERKGWSWLKLIAGSVGLVGLLLALERLELRARLEPLAEWVDSFGGWAPVAFILVNAGVGMVPVPGLILTTVALAGVLFGAIYGTLYAFLGCALAAITGFALARRFGRSRALTWLEEHPRLAALDAAMEEDGLRIMVLVRVAIVFPFSVQSYGLGLTRATWRDFIPSLLAMLPGTVFYAVAGAMIGNIAEVVHADGLGPQGWWRIGLYAVGVFVILVLARLLMGAARRALEERTGLEHEPDPAPQGSEGG